MNCEEVLAPGILKKSASGIYALEARIHALENKVEEYKARLATMETELSTLFEEDDSNVLTPVIPIRFPPSWTPDAPPSLTQLDREKRIQWDQIMTKTPFKK